MRSSRAVLLLLGGLTAALLLARCGGDDKKTPLATLSKENAEAMAQNMADAMPGCTYQAAGASRAVLPEDPGPARSVSLAFKAVVEKARSRALAYRAAKRATEDVYETEEGDCGGSYVSEGTHKDGDTRLTISFDGYCMEAGDGQTTMQGSISMAMDGTPSDDGPVIDEIRVSTGGSGITVESTGDGEPQTYAIVLDGLKMTMGDPGGEPTEADPVVITAKRLKVSENGEMLFDVQDVDVSMWSTGQDGEDMAVRIDNVTYTDAEIGTVDVSSNTMVMGEETIEGELTVTGADGTSVTVGSDPYAEGVLTLRQGGADVGAIDCSSLAEDAGDLLGDDDEEWEG